MSYVFIAVLAAILIYAGVSKLVGPSATRWVVRFARWGYPAGFAQAIGLIEVVAPLAFFVSATRRIAAAIVICVMLGAVGTHLIHGEFVRIIPPVILGAGTLVVWRQVKGKAARQNAAPY